MSQKGFGVFEPPYSNIPDTWYICLPLTSNSTPTISISSPTDRCVRLSTWASRCYPQLFTAGGDGVYCFVVTPDVIVYQSHFLTSIWMWILALTLLYSFGLVVGGVSWPRSLRLWHMWRQRYSIFIQIVGGKTDDNVMIKYLCPSGYLCLFGGTDRSLSLYRLQLHQYWIVFLILRGEGEVGTSLWRDLFFSVMSFLWRRIFTSWNWEHPTTLNEIINYFRWLTRNCLLITFPHNNLTKHCIRRNY